jgi:hypothetical protein
MNRKLSLDLDALSVDSFETTDSLGASGGTVKGHVDDTPAPTPPVYADNCTCRPTDLCRTAYYYCGTGPYTIHSCHYTQNVSCAVTA